ncbi:MAG: ABC transporter permease [Promethearchaeota archaeon]
MIQKIYAEFLKSFKSWQRYKILIAVGLVSPFFFTFIFTQVFTFTVGTGFPLAVICEDEPIVPGSYTDSFIEVLNAKEGTIPYFEVFTTTPEQAEILFSQRQIFVVVTIPSGFDENLTVKQPVTIHAKINNIHEDLSKNIRLGLESRIFQFITINQLNTSDRPGITYTSDRVYAVELPRANYMVWGILVWVTVFTSLFYGGSLGAEEKDKKTITEISMNKHGLIYSRIGKTLATVLISAICVAILLFLNFLLYQVTFPSIFSFGCFWLVFLCLAFPFSLFGVSYGLKVGDFRMVPVPSILISLTLWIISGAINPLEFSVGAEVFKYLPTAAGIRILTVVIFNRGLQYFTEALLILGAFLIIGIIATVLIVTKNIREGI